MKAKKIKINGLQHQFYFWGSPKKPKLFLFHGWLDGAASFDFVCEYLAKYFYCIAPDLRGYGKSEHSKSPLGYFFYEYIADLHSIFAKFSPQQAVKILGHSFGGGISSFYAGIYPERVSHFINVEGFAFRDNSAKRGPEKAKAWLEGLTQQRFNHFKNLQHFAERLVKSNPRLALERAQFIAKHLAKKVHGGVAMAADPLHKLAEPYVFSKEIFYPFWQSIRAQCLLVSAELTEMNDWMKSSDLKKEIQDRLAQFPPESQKVEIKNCGHMIHHEKPEELAALSIEFLL